MALLRLPLFSLKLLQIIPPIIPNLSSSLVTAHHNLNPYDKKDTSELFMPYYSTPLPIIIPVFANFILFLVLQMRQTSSLYQLGQNPQLPQNLCRLPQSAQLFLPQI